MPETAEFSYGRSGAANVLLIEEPETFLHIASSVDGVSIFDQQGKVIGTVHLNPAFDPDEVPGLTDEDRVDIRKHARHWADARVHGTIPWEQVNAELGL